MLQRELVSTLATAEPLTTVPRVLDVDDAVFLMQRWGSIDRIARRVDLAICGNSWLADYFAQHCKATVVPTAVDTNRYVSACDRSDRSRVTIGWMGTHPNLTELDCVAPSIKRVLDARPDAHMLVVSDRAPAWALRAHRGVEYRPWSAARELADLSEFDIGIMPLVNTPWTQGKCGYKLLTYMSCGVAAVASPVGANVEILRGLPGAVASTTDEWFEALVTLVDDEALRRDCGRAGRERAVERYSVQAVAPTLARALQGVTCG